MWIRFRCEPTARGDLVTTAEGARRRHRAAGTFALLAALTTGLAPSAGRAAGAQSKDQKPGTRSRAMTVGAPEQRLYRRGEALFREGRYAAAAQAYSRGYEVSGLPGFLLNMADCYWRLGQLRRARDAYARYLHEDQGSPRAPEVTRRLAEIDASLPPRPALGNPTSDELANRPNGFGARAELAAPSALETTTAAEAPRVDISELRDPLTGESAAKDPTLTTVSRPPEPALTPVALAEPTMPNAADASRNVPEAEPTARPPHRRAWLVGAVVGVLMVAAAAGGAVLMAHQGQPERR